MRLAYLVNQYPHPSHTFIRREIAALEKLGMPIARITVRRSSAPLVDADDLAEADRTRVLLSAGAPALVWAAARAAIVSPILFARALVTAAAMAAGSRSGLWRHLAYLVEACLLLRWLRAEAIDHVHAHFGTNATTVAMLCRALGGPKYSFTVHGPEEFDRPETLDLGRKIANAAFTVAISDFGRSQLYRWCDPAHWPRIHVCRCGVDERFLSAPITEPPPDHRLVCVGRLSEQKGQLVLLEAARKLVEAGESFELLLIGDGPMRGQLESAIAQHGLEETVRLLGWRDADGVRDAILRSRAMVLPSFAEGLPVVLMEALALGRPVISTQVAAIPELVQDRVNGWLVPPASVDALVDAMRQALHAPLELLGRLGAAGARLVAERHNTSTEAGKLRSLFESGGALPLPAANASSAELPPRGRQEVLSHRHEGGGPAWP